MVSYWDGRAVLVTGATSGIGKATAVYFGSLGATAIVHGRDPELAASVAQDIRHRGGAAHAVSGDLQDPEACSRVVREAADHGPLAALVNNAGVNVFTGTLDATLDDWNNCLDVDLRAVWLCSKAAAALMPSGSAIINVTSNHAQATLPGCFPYNVAKAGVNALTQSLALELAGVGVRVNAVAPGYIDTPINDSYFGTFPDPGEARRSAEALHPVGRLGTAEEVANAIEFLADGSRSGFTTGVVLTLDGGRSALLQDPQREAPVQVPAPATCVETRQP